MSRIQRYRRFVDRRSEHRSMASCRSPTNTVQGYFVDLCPVCKTRHRAANFEFRQILLVCLRMGNMGTPTTTPPCVVFQFYPSLAWNVLSPTTWNPSFRNHRIWRATCNWQMGEVPLAKIPCHESNKIDGSLIEVLSIDLWRVVGHLHIQLRDA